MIKDITFFIPHILLPFLKSDDCITHNATLASSGATEKLPKTRKQIL